MAGLPPFPSEGDPLHYKTQSRWPSRLKSPPWSLDVSQCLVPHISCSPTSASYQALHFTGLPGRCAPTSPPRALSDAGVREYLRACTVEEPLTGQVSLDLNALFLGTQTCPLPSDCAYTMASRWLHDQHTRSSSLAQPSSCLMQKMPRAPPARLHARQSVVPPGQKHLTSCVYTQPLLGHQILVSVFLLSQ